MKILFFSAVLASVVGACTVAARGPEENAAGVIALDMDVSSGRPLIEVSAGGTRGRFILDTGAATVVVQSSFARAANARVLGSTRLGSPLGGEPVEAERVEIENAAVGGIELGALNATSIPDDTIPLPGAVGVLPMRALTTNHVVELDFGAGSLNLSDRPLRPIQEWTRRSFGSPILQTTLTIGGADIVAHIDTGNPGRILLPIAYARTLGVDAQLRQAGRMRTVDAQRDIYEAPYQGSVEIAGVRLNVDALRFADVPAANVGVLALSGLVLVIDRGGERFALRGSTAGAPALQAETPTGGAPVRLGLRAVPGPGHIYVDGADPGSRAERAGLQAGDSIVAINGAAVSDLSPSTIGERMRATPLTFTVERNGERLEIDVPDR
jgi:predicted aspartyl protease